MTKTVVFDGKAKRAGLVRAGASKSKMNITSESQDRNKMPSYGMAVADNRVRTDVFPTLQGTGMQEIFLLSTL